VNLLLSAVDIVGPRRWRWELRDEETGEVIAEHQVSLESPADSSQVDALGDLYEYVRWHIDPLWRDDEQRIIREIGTWARDAVLGDAVTAAIIAAAPATVLVSVPAPADEALLWPLELAFADGAPLAARGDVSFVYCVGHSTPVPADPARPLRILAAFPKPAGTGITTQRRKRHGLAELIAAIASRDGTAIELQVLQYGVTRQRLREAIAAGGGWDVVHLAGHGGRGTFLLDQPDGSIDRVSAADLAGLLRPARGRLKLAVLASCESAAEAAPDTLRLLGLPAKAAETTADQVTGQVSGLAKGLARELGCAVVATRYLVTDEFSIAFNQVFYDLLLSRGEPAGVATASALATVLAAASAGGPVLGGGPAVAVPAIPAPANICAATLGVFGAPAATVTLRAAPADAGGAKVAGPAAGRMAGFPDQPARFVGRDALMTTLSTALRPGSGSTAVLLQGMPGIGKSACALELAYLCQDQFSAVAFWRPPAQNDPDLMRDAVDRELAAYWEENGHWVPGRAGAALAALPYLVRRRDWDRAAELLGSAIRHDALPTGEGSYLPQVREVARATAAPAASAALALATQPADQPVVRRLLEDSLAGAESAGDHSLAWMVAGHLADELRESGHPDQALAVLTRQEQYARAAGLGPWTKLVGHSDRLAVLAQMGRKEQAIVEVADVRDRMRRLAAAPTSGELPGVVPSAVRERILGIGRDCALAFRRWPDALDFGAEIQESQRQRRASRAELTRIRLFDAYPLIRLRRLTEAAELLVECQQVFEGNDDFGNLSHVFTERADLESELGHADAAVRFARSALRMTYTRTIPVAIADAHQRLARYLRTVGGPAEEQQAHWLAAALLHRLSGEDRAVDRLMLVVPRGLRVGHGRRQPGIAGPPPRSLADLIDIAEQTSGVHLAELIASIEPDSGTVIRTLAAILDSAAGQGPAAASLREQARGFLFDQLGGYELASNPDVVSLVNRFRGWLGSQADQNRTPEQG
jgi:hypothetical protein